MKKGQLPVFAELTLADTEDFTSKPARNFTGTDNPRHLRALHALMTRPIRRKHLDAVAGCSNGPELIAELRRRGLKIPCKRVPGRDRDGHPVLFGVYHLTNDDRRKVRQWLSERK